jgi:hypothetical protein
MYETMALDSNTVIIKSDSQKELSDIMAFISKKGEAKNRETLLKLASENRKRIKQWTCSVTRLVTEQALQFFRLKPYKMSSHNRNVPYFTTIEMSPTSMRHERPGGFFQV